jgi:hypothetical protein
MACAAPAAHTPTLHFTADISMLGLVIPAEGSLPYLSSEGWVIGGAATDDPKPLLLERAQRGGNWDGGDIREAAILVSLGPSPTYASFLQTAQSLREMNLCLAFVREGGEPSGVIGGVAQVEVIGLRIC